MTDPKRMTAVRFLAWRYRDEQFLRTDGEHELFAALSAERARSEKVEAEKEALRQRNIERNEKQFQKCSCCQQRWAYGAPELHLDGCLAAPTEKA